MTSIGLPSYVSIVWRFSEWSRLTAQSSMIGPVKSSGVTMVARIVGSRTCAIAARPTAPGCGKSAGLSIEVSSPYLSTTAGALSASSCKVKGKDSRFRLTKDLVTSTSD